MIKNIAASLVATIALSGTALAGTYHLSDIDKDQSSVSFISMESIQEVRPGIKRFWQVTTYKYPQFSYDIYMGMGLVEADCRGRRVRVIESRVFDGKARIAGTHKQPNETWDYVAPDSLGYANLSVVCEGITYDKKVPQTIEIDDFQFLIQFTRDYEFK